jgi:AcrR family transcriptional regulator
MAVLAARSGTPPATIHHYRRLGLLPQPARASPNRFLYDERHVRALRLIEALRRRRRMPLPVVRRILPDLLAMEGDEAFRPEMWDRAVDVRTRGRAGRTPEARLLDAALDAFTRRGYGEVNVDDLCRTARIAKGSFYRHHQSKEDLFLAAARAAAVQAGESYARAFPASEVLSGLPGLSDGERAAEALAGAMEPRFPIFLELLARASQLRTGYAATAAEVFGLLAESVGRHMAANTADGGSFAASGQTLIERALALLVRRTVTAQPAAGTSAPGIPAAGQTTR